MMEIWQNFVYFKNTCNMWYPVGQYFSSNNFDYIREAASSINKVFPKQVNLS